VTGVSDFLDIRSFVVGIVISGVTIDCTPAMLKIFC